MGLRVVRNVFLSAFLRRFFGGGLSCVWRIGTPFLNSVFTKSKTGGFADKTGALTDFEGVSARLS